MREKSNDLLGDAGDLPYASTLGPSAPKRHLDPNLPRAVTSDLAHGLLQLSSQPAVLFLMMMRYFQGPEAKYSAQVENYEPVARAFGMPFVSYRDAIWPTEAAVPSPSRHLFDVGVTIHPRQHTFQLVADTLAYAW